MDQNKLPSDPRLRRLIEAAIRSPSGDNCQPWRFRFDSKERLLIEFVPEQAKSFFDFRYCGTLISVGAVIENVRIQAASEGLATDVTYSWGEEAGNLAAIIDLRPDPITSVSPARVDAMLQRTVTRRPFSPIRVPQQKLDALLADSVDGTGVRVIDSRREIGQWARLIYLADRIRYTHPVIHEELFAKVQFTREDAQRTRIGLEIDRLGAGPAAGAIMRFLQPWPRTQRLQKVGIDRFLAGQSRFLALSTGALVLVTLPDDTPHDWIRAGEQVERLWVGAQEQGLCVHPMTVVLYLARRYQQEGMAGFLPQHRTLLEKMQTGLDTLLGDQVGAMIFRLGHGWRMHSTAVRLPVEEFLGD